MLHLEQAGDSPRVENARADDDASNLALEVPVRTDVVARPDVEVRQQRESAELRAECGQRRGAARLGARRGLVAAVRNCRQQRARGSVEKGDTQALPAYC